MIKTRTLKNTLRKIYKAKKALDAKDIGRKLNDFTQALHLQFRLKEKDRDKELMKQCIGGIEMIKKEHRFRDDFPSFPKFYNYITNPKNGFTLEDVKEL